MITHNILKKEIQHSTLLEKSVLLLAILMPLFALPQVIKLFSEKNAQSMSLPSYTLLAIASLLWLCYGIKRKDSPLIITNILWFIMHTSIVIATLLY